ncbi:MAG: peptidylprolyl isomerase [Acidimicrobiales bacterium]
MPKLLLRFLTIFVVFAFVAAACSSDDDATTAADSADAEGDLIEGADAGETDASDEDAAESDAAATGDAAPVGGADDAFVAQVASVFLGNAPVTGETLTCIGSAADADTGDEAFASAMAMLQSGEEQPSDDGFAALVTTIRDCAGVDVHNDVLVDGLTLGQDRPEVSTCVADAFAAADSDEPIVAMTALVLGWRLTPESQAPVVDVLVTCVPDDILATQYTSIYESRTGFSVAVDTECLADELASMADPESFWNALLQVTDGVEALAEADAMAETCADDPDADLADEVPADFEPWAGTGALAGVRPDLRDGLYAEAPPMLLAEGVDYQAVITTADGEIVLDLYEDSAPLTVNNFVALARDGFYDRTVFHRVLPDFMAQGGDPTGTGSGGPGYTFADEVDGGPSLDRRGLLAMANAGPGTNGSQFFITFTETDYLTGAHTVFGEVLDGDDVLAQIDLRDPQQPITRGEVIESVVITEN